MSLWRAGNCIAVCWLTLCSANRVGAQDDLARWIPPDANCVAVVRVKEMLASPVGRRDRWSQEHREKFAAGEIAAPPGVDLMVRSTEFRLSGENSTTYTVLRTLQDSPVRTIAQRDKAVTEQVQGHRALRSRSVYLVDIAPKLMGMVEPGDRQVLARWLKLGDSGGESTQHPFLKEALLGGDDRPQIIIALDLTEMFDAPTLTRWLSSAPAGEQFPNAQALAALFATIQGARLAVLVNDDIVARLTLSFGQSVGNLGNDVARLVRAWADESGARIDSNRPTVGAEGNTVTMEKGLDSDGLRRIMSLIRTPHVPTPGEQMAAAPREATPDAAESSRYFQAVNRLVDSLNRQNRNANDYLKTATWHENFARQILSLPTEGVDPELVQWAATTAEALQGLAVSLRGVPIQVNDLQKSIHYNVASRNYRYASTPFADLYRNAWQEVNTNLPAIRAKQADVVAQNASERDSVWQMIQQDRVAISKRMHDRYGAAFKSK